MHCCHQIFISYLLIYVFPCDFCFFVSHMNNNSISGQIPPELSKLPKLLHLLLDNNNLSGYLPPELAQIPNLRILQLDNNNFEGSHIPDSYGNMSRLLKLSLRNCSLQGPVPNLGNIPNLTYIDLSLNELIGSIPSNMLSDNMTTINILLLIVVVICHTTTSTELFLQTFQAFHICRNCR